MLLSSFAWADPYRWLERTHAPDVIEWSEARDAEARAWIDAGGETTELEAWAERARESEDEGRTLQDLAGPTRIYREWRRETPQGAPRVLHATLVAVRDGVETALRDDLDDTHSLCAETLDASGRFVAWGRQIEPPPPSGEHRTDPKPCRMYVTDLAEGRTWTLLEAIEPRVVFGPDASHVLVTHVVAKTGRLTEYTRDGALVAERLRNPHRLAAQWLPDGHVFVTTGVRASQTSFPRVQSNRLAWGTSEEIDWLGNALFWPPWGAYSLVGQAGDDLLLRTNVDADAWKVVRVDPEAPWKQKWETVIPENPASRLVDARRFGDRLLLVRQVDGTVELLTSPLDGGDETPIGFTASGSISLQVRGDVSLVTGWSVDGKRQFTLDGELTSTAVGEEPNLARFESVNVVSADGTTVPVSIARPREARPDAPVWIEAYGGFGVNETPYYSWSVQRWLELGGVYAWVHARGGGERGEAWHEAAKRGNKSKTIDDVIAAAEWFATRGSERIVLSGASNGGLTVTAAVARRPDLFGAVVARSGVYDLVRGPRMGNWWPDEYGRPNGAERDALTALSPLLATPPGPLPPILLVTGRDDPRVTPAHSFKLANAWSKLPGGPVLLRVTPWVSHARPGDNADLPPDAWDGLWAEEFAFVLRALGMSDG